MQAINTVILSFGMSGRVFHAPFIELHPGLTLYGVLERTKQASLQFYPTIKIYRTLEEVLADKNVDLVIVNTPNNTHYEFTKKVLEAGKHAVVEKAFTTTVAEAEELAALATKKGLMLSVYQNRRFDSDFNTVKQVIEAGILGDIHEAEFHYDRYRVALSPKLHKEVPGPGAGILNDLGPHLIDQAICLFGMPDQIFADIRTIRPDSLVDDCFTMILFYKDKRVTLKSNILVREAMPASIVHGINGSFIKSRADVQEAALIDNIKPNLTDWGIEPESEQGLLHTAIDGQIVRKKIPSARGNYYAYYEGIYDALVQNIDPPVTAQEGINVMKIIEAAQKSNGNLIQL
jgi:predicted dehydrogenase